MGRHVVDAVVEPRQHHVVVLQPHHPTRQTEVGMRPFVDLKHNSPSLETAERGGVRHLVAIVNFLTPPCGSLDER